MDGGEEKDAKGSSSTVTVTEPVADSKKLSKEVEANVEDEKTSAGVDEEVGVSGSGCGDGGREESKSRVVLGFDGHEVDLEKDAEEEEEEEGVTGTVDDLGTVQDMGEEAWSPINKSAEWNPLEKEDVGKDGEGKVDDEGGEDVNVSEGLRNSGEGASLKESSIDEERLATDVSAGGDTELVEGSSVLETVVTETETIVETVVTETVVETVVTETEVADDSQDEGTCVRHGSTDGGDGDIHVMDSTEDGEPSRFVQGSEGGDTQILDDSGDSNAALNDASAEEETQVVPGLLNQDGQVVGISGNKDIDGSRDEETLATHDSKDRETQVFVDGSKDGENGLGSVDEDMQVVEDSIDNDIDCCREGETQVNDGPKHAGAQILQDSVSKDVSLVDCSRDGDVEVNDHANDGVTRVTHSSSDDTQVIEDPDTHDVNVSKNLETEITNGSSGQETQVADDSMDVETEVVNFSVDVEEQVEVADTPAISKDENVERGLKEESAPISIEDLNYKEVSPSEQDMNSPGMADDLMDVETEVVNGSVDAQEQAEVADTSAVSKDETVERGLTEEVAPAPVEDLNSQEGNALEHDINDPSTSGSLEDTCGEINQVSPATEKAELVEEQPIEIVETNQDVAQYSELKLESAFTEDVGQKCQVPEEAHVVMVSDDGSCPPREATSGDPMENVPRLEMTSSSVNDSVLMEKNEIEYPTCETLDKVMQVSVQGNIASVDDGEITCPNIEDLPSFSQPTDVFIGGEVASTMEEKNQQETRVAGKLVEANKEGLANGSIHSPDSTSSFHSTQAVAGDDVAEMDHVVGFDARGSGNNPSAFVQNDVSASNTGFTNASPTSKTMMVHPTKDAEETTALDQLCQHDVKERGVDTTDDKSPQWANLHWGSFANAQQAKYQLPSDFDGEFCVSDLVWGKVRSHPRWPGQIFDPADASEQALKYQKKDSFLVAYFGDRTFAWNEPHLLKPFRSHFSQSEKQSHSEAFQTAVDSALEEVSRRVEMGLACSCVPNADRYKIEVELVGNAGIQDEAIKRGDVDISRTTEMFDPVNLINYVKSLAQSPSAGADRVELAILRSQLLSFYRLKGYSPLPEFQCFGESLEDGEAINHACEDDLQRSTLPNSQTQKPCYHKRKHNLKDGVYPGKKVQSLTISMDDSWDSVEFEEGASAKRRKGPDPFSDGSEEVKTVSLAKISTAPKPSFKIGDCIRRAASQMTGSPSILKSNSQKFDDEYDFGMPQSDEGENNSVASLEVLLLQLRSAARDPLQRCSFSNRIVGFFSDYRNSVVVDQQDLLVDKRRKVFHSVGDSETYEFVDMNDTYWTDRVIENGSEEKPTQIENGSEEKPTRKSKKRENLFVPVTLDKPVQRSNARKRYSEGNNNFNVSQQEKPPGYVDAKAPAELVMHFPVVDSVPSEMKLNKMFKSFGPLKESGTEVDRDTNRARVVFKHSSDAEAAYGSASKFNIFGSLLVNYQLNYTISEPFKSVPISVTHGDEDANVFLQY
ncbi:PWWP domain-containing protein 2 [Linum grandiflorum]